MDGAFSIAEAERLMNVTRPTIEARIGKDLEALPQAKPKRLTRASVVNAYSNALQAAREKVERLEASGREFGVLPASPRTAPAASAPEGSSRPTRDARGAHSSVEASTVPTSEAHLAERLAAAYDELASERAGRSAAELKIDELKRQVRQANAAIDALQPQPDANLDDPS